MLIIPVLDIRSGQVVEAQGGRRERYQPLVSRLAASSHPEAVLGGLLGLHPFEVVYLADLDAIERRGNNLSAVRGLTACFPRLSFWVDAGFTEETEVLRWQGAGRVRPVIGSESHGDAERLNVLLSIEFPERPVLSLDFYHGELRGPPEVLAHARTWLGPVILMELARVGTGTGPDIQRLKQMRVHAPSTAFYAAGGVRGAHDLHCLAACGASGALVASSLHQGQLGARGLARWAPAHAF